MKAVCQQYYRAHKHRSLSLRSDPGVVSRKRGVTGCGDRNCKEIRRFPEFATRESGRGLPPTGESSALVGGVVARPRLGSQKLRLRSRGQYKQAKDKGKIVWIKP